MPIWWIVASVGSLCLLATLANLLALYRTMSPPFFLQSTLLKKRLCLLSAQSHSPKKKQCSFPYYLFILRPSDGEADADASVLVSIFSFTPSVCTRSCAALIILIIRFPFSFSPVCAFLYKAYFSALLFPKTQLLEAGILLYYLF